MVLRVATRLEIEGQDRLPEPGGVILCPNHPGVTADIHLPHVFWEGDLRTMVDINHFCGRHAGAFGSWSGAYPVDKQDASPVTKQHSRQLLAEGKDLLLFPEGRYSEVEGRLSPLKRGAAAFALGAPARAVVPIAIHYQADEQPRLREEFGALGLGLAAGVGAAVVGGGLGGAFAGATVGALTAGTAVRVTGSRLLHGRANDQEDDYRALTLRRAARDPGVRAGLTVLGGIAGGLVGGLLGHALAPGVDVAAVLAGLGVLGLGLSRVHRDVIGIKIGEPVETAPYLEESTPREAKTPFTEELHRRIGGELATLSGVCYDETVAKL